MKSVITFCLLSLMAFGQTQAREVWAAGLSVSPESSPPIAGTALWARELSESQHYAFAIVDVLPTNRRPYAIESNIGAGLAERMFTIHRYTIWVPVALDVSNSGVHTGWSWTAGGMLAIPWKDHWQILPSLRVLHSDVSNNSGAQLILGVMIGWAK